jgi:hypothetical protein
VDSHLPHFPRNVKAKLCFLHQFRLCMNCFLFRVLLYLLLMF